MKFRSIDFSKILSTNLLGMVAAVVLPAVAASAATFEPGVNYHVTNQSGTSNPFKDSSGGNAWYRVVKINVNGTTTSGAGAGVFRMKATGGSLSGEDFLAYCLSPWQELSQPNAYHTDPTLGLRSQTLGQLGALVKNAWSLVNNRNTAAAFQVAAWEIVTENFHNPLNLNSGAFKLEGIKYGGYYYSDAYGVRTLAQGWLNNITSADWTGSGFSLLKYANECKKTQNLLTVAPVPLPASGVLMLAGFGLLAGMRRRKRAA